MTDSEIVKNHVTKHWSEIVRHNGTLYLCGQTSYGHPAETIEDQTDEVLRRVETLLTEAGSSKSKILHVTIHIQSLDHYAGMNARWDAYFSGMEPPARTTVKAGLVLDELLVELTVIAAA